jgi:hypothetical protein
MVITRERAFFEDKERPALVGLLMGSVKAMKGEPFPEIDSFFIPLYFRWSARK